MPPPVFAFYNDRGECENRIAEFKNGFRADRLGRHRFLANAFRLLLHGSAYNLVNLFRPAVAPALALSAQIETLRAQLFKIGARVRQTARCTDSLESAAVQSDVGSDRAATGTDGVEKRWSSQQRNLPYKVDKGKVLQKQCQQMRDFGSHGAERRSLQQLQMELASNHAPGIALTTWVLLA